MTCEVAAVAWQAPKKSVAVLKQDWRDSGRIQTSSRATKAILLADALLFDPDAKSELVEFLLHPVPHTGTWRRLFPCGVISQVRFSRLISPPAPGAEQELRAYIPWWTCRFVGVFCESTTGKVYLKWPVSSSSHTAHQIVISHLFSTIYVYSERDSRTFPATRLGREIQSFFSAES